MAALSLARSRRWFRFTLRTLFVVLTVLGCIMSWLAWNYHAVWQRDRLLGLLRERRVSCEIIDRAPHPSIPWGWRLLGARQVDFNSLYLAGFQFTTEETAAVQKFFPEIVMIDRKPITNERQ